MDERELIRRRRLLELASFLRKRRAALAPEDAGIRIRGRRHVGGLRREEVAALAGIGTSWYTMLEQGRVARVGAKVIEGLAVAFRLSDAEQAYVRALTQDPPPVERAGSHADALAALVRGYDEAALFAASDLADVTSWNAFADRLFGFSDVPQDERNLLAMMVRRAELRAAFPDWEDTLAHMIGVFRGAYARTVPGGRADALATELQQQSPIFAELWSRHAIYAPVAHVCRMRSQGRERRFHFVTLVPVGTEAETLVALVPTE